MGYLVLGLKTRLGEGDEFLTVKSISEEQPRNNRTNERNDERWDGRASIRDCEEWKGPFEVR